LDIKEDAQLSHDEMVAMVFLLRQSRISSVGRFSSSRSVLVPGADKLLRNPITGIAGCCASAASGHAAAPPSSCMSSEHFGQLAWQFKRVSGSSGLKVQAAIAC
jgi:hypothetical protein